MRAKTKVKPSERGAFDCLILVQKSRTIQFKLKINLGISEGFICKSETNIEYSMCLDLTILFSNIES